MQKTLKKRRSGGYDKSREVTEMAYQKDISAILGVSVATVSKALKGYSDVSEKTRRKVLQTAAVLALQTAEFPQALFNLIIFLR